MHKDSLEKYNRHERIGIFQLVIFLLSITILVILFIDATFKLPVEASKILGWVDDGVCFFFLVDFCIRFHYAPSKIAFMKWGWIDLLSSVPNIPVLRIGRLVIVLRIIRLVRTIRATQKLSTIIFRDKFKGGMISILISFALLIIFSSVGILICEQQNPYANIKTAQDAIWWSICTVTTVGYGDVYPTTLEGKCLGMIIMLAGVGMFSFLSGLIAYSLIGKKNNLKDKEEIITLLKNLDEKIKSLK